MVRGFSSLRKQVEGMSARSLSLLAPCCANLQKSYEAAKQAGLGSPQLLLSNKSVLMEHDDRKLS